MPAAGPLFGRGDRQPGHIPAHRVSQAASAYLHESGSASTLHALRHRFGTKIYGVSKDLRVTQELLGHSSPVTTALYAQWSPQAAVDAVLAIA